MMFTKRLRGDLFTIALCAPALFGFTQPMWRLEWASRSDVVLCAAASLCLGAAAVLTIVRAIRGQVGLFWGIVLTVLMLFGAIGLYGWWHGVVVKVLAISAAA